MFTAMQGNAMFTAMQGNAMFTAMQGNAMFTAMQGNVMFGDNELDSAYNNTPVLLNGSTICNAWETWAGLDLHQNVTITDKSSGIHYGPTITIRMHAGELPNVVTKPSVSNHKQTTFNWHIMGTWFECCSKTMNQVTTSICMGLGNCWNPCLHYNDKNWKKCSQLQLLVDLNDLLS